MDITNYVQCGERGNEMAEVLMDFPEVRGTVQVLCLLLTSLAHHRGQRQEGAYHEAHNAHCEHLQHACGCP